MSISTISSLIKNDHKIVEDLYKNYLSSKGNVNEQESFARQFQMELTKHYTAKEMILYPAFELYLAAEGKKIADQDRAEQQAIKNLLSLVQSKSVSDPEHHLIFGELMTNLNKHIKREETDDLPQLESALTSESSAALAQTFEQAKMSITL